MGQRILRREFAADFGFRWFVGLFVPADLNDRHFDRELMRKVGENDLFSWFLFFLSRLVELEAELHS